MKKPAWVARLERNGDMESALVHEALPVQRTIYYVFGFAAVAIGLFLLIGSVINVTNISW